MAAVEYRDLTRLGHLLVNAPQVIVGALFLVGRSPAHGVHAQRAHAAKHARMVPSLPDVSVPCRITSSL